MFASGVGKPVCSHGGVRVAAATYELVKNAGEAIDDLFAERRAELLRPDGLLDTVETLGWLLGDVLTGKLVTHEQAKAAGKKAGKMVFGKSATMVGPNGWLTQLDRNARARVAKQPADSRARAAKQREADEERAERLRAPVKLPLPPPPKAAAQKRKRSPLCEPPQAAPPVCSSPVVDPGAATSAAPEFPDLESCLSAIKEKIAFARSTLEEMQEEREGNLPSLPPGETWESVTAHAEVSQQFMDRFREQVVQRQTVERVRCAALAAGVPLYMMDVVEVSEDGSHGWPELEMRAQPPPPPSDEMVYCQVWMACADLVQLVELHEHQFTAPAVDSMQNWLAQQCAQGS